MMCEVVIWCCFMAFIPPVLQFCQSTLAFTTIRFCQVKRDYSCFYDKCCSSCYFFKKRKMIHFTKAHTISEVFVKILTENFCAIISDSSTYTQSFVKQLSMTSFTAIKFYILVYVFETERKALFFYIECVVRSSFKYYLFCHSFGMTLIA